MNSTLIMNEDRL